MLTEEIELVDRIYYGDDFNGRIAQDWANSRVGWMLAVLVIAYVIKKLLQGKR